MSKPDKNLHFHCHCGRALEAVWKSKHLFGKKEWIAEKCPICHTAKDLSNAGTAICPHCDHLVLKDEKFCPVCMQPVDISIERVPVQCPNEDCGMTIYLPKNFKGDYTCRYCEHKISEAKIHKLLKDSWVGQNAPAKLIVLPSAAAMSREGTVIHQMEDSSFPRNSRLQVGENTWALLMQNGISQSPLNPGIHLLEDSGLSLSSKLDAAASGEEVVFNTTIFCVAKNLPEIKHATINSTPIVSKHAGNVSPLSYSVTAEGFTLRCAVADAKAFVANVGFKPLNEATFKQEHGWMMDFTGKLLTSAFDAAAHEAFEIWDASRNEYAYQSEILRAIGKALVTPLAERGLSLEDVSIQALKVKPAKDLAPDNIQLPDSQQMLRDRKLISKYDGKAEFTFLSRVQVSEGTYGLMLRNGVCQDVLVPGDYLLQDCNLEGIDLYTAAGRGKDITFTLSLFTVQKNLPVLNWTRVVIFSDLEGDGNAPAKEYAIKVDGTVSLQVDNAKAFADAAGFRELTVDDLEKGWLFKKLISTMDTMMGTACQAVIGRKLDTHRMDMYRQPFGLRMKDDLGAAICSIGLSVLELNISTIAAFETEESQAKQQKNRLKEEARKAVLAAVQNSFTWGISDISLHVADDLAQTVTASFSGDCRLSVKDQKKFLQLPEVFQAQEDYKIYPESSKRMFSDLKQKLENMICNKITSVAQQSINDGHIANIEDSIAYTHLDAMIKDKLNHDLESYGLELLQFSMNQPVIHISKALQDHKGIEDKKQKIKAYAESELKLQTEPIRVHMKDDATVYVQAVFSGSAHLRVADDNAFFATSEVHQFLVSDPFVSAATVTEYYTKRLNTLFADIIDRIIQAFVDQTNADIQELNRLSGLLSQKSLLDSLNARANGFGMRLDSLDMGMPSIVEKSSNMETWLKHNQIKSGTALEQEILRLKNDKVIFEYSEDGRVTIAKQDVDTQKDDATTTAKIHQLDNQDKIDAKATELLKHKADRQFNEKMDQLRRDNEIRRLMDEFASSGDDRDFARLQKRFQHEYELQEAAIHQAIREAQIRQQGDIDAKLREQQADFKRMINEAENRQLLNSIMHKIAESDLDWQKKLDEYTRLQHRTRVEDQVELDKLIAHSKMQQAEQAAMSDMRIKREANEIYMIIGNTKIALAEKEAELIEKIARYNEERHERIINADTDRAERKATLAFEQRLRDRQEQVIQDMEKLKQKYEYDLAIRDRDDKLSAMQYEQNKLVHTLDYLRHALTTRADVDKSRFDAEKEIEKAKAQYDAQHAKEVLQAEEKRWQEKLKHDEVAAQHAENYQKMLAQLQVDLEKLRNDTQCNQNDNAAKVGVAQAESNATKNANDVMNSINKLNNHMDKRFHDLSKEMERIRRDYQELKRKVNDTMDHGKNPPVRVVPVPTPVPQNPYVQPQYPPYGGSYGYSKDVNDLFVTGGLNVDGRKSSQDASAYSFGAQPGMSDTCICPTCKRTCSSRASICEHCGNPI